MQFHDIGTRHKERNFTFINRRPNFSNLYVISDMNFHCIYNGLESYLYGLWYCFRENNETTRTVFRSKKIADTDIYPVTKLDVLVSRFNAGDTVICISVDRYF